MSQNYLIKSTRRFPDVKIKGFEQMSDRNLEKEGRPELQIYTKGQMKTLTS